MSNIKKKVGIKIFELRKAAGLTQEKLAEKVGINTESISRIERGIRAPSFENLEKLAEALKVEPKDLFDFRGEDFKALARYNHEVLKLCNYLNSKDTTRVKQLEKIAKIICSA